MMIYGIIMVQLAINYIWCMIVTRTNLKMQYQTSSFFWVVGAIAALIFMNITVAKCSEFVNRNPYSTVFLVCFTLLECHIAAWFASMFFEGALVPLLLGCAALTSFIIVGVSWFYSRNDSEDNAYLDKVEGWAQAATDKIESKINEGKEGEEAPAKTGKNKRIFLYVLCGIVCLTTIILTCAFDEKTKWYHALLVCIGMVLWIYIFVENVMMIMEGKDNEIEEKESLKSYIVGARNVYGNFLNTFWWLLKWVWEWMSKTCAKKDKAPEAAKDKDAKTE